MLNLTASQLRYVEAMQNYVVIWYVQEHSLQKEMLRATVSSIEKQLNETEVVRCHRSYLVNTNTIKSVSGNAQGLKLKLTDVTDVEVPVSRSFIPKTREFAN